MIQLIKLKNIKKESFIKELIKKIILMGYSSAFVAGTESKKYLLKLGFDEKKFFYHGMLLIINFYQNHVPENKLPKKIIFYV